MYKRSALKRVSLITMALILAFTLGFAIPFVGDTGGSGISKSQVYAAAGTDTAENPAAATTGADPLAAAPKNPTLQWIKNYGGSNYDRANSVTSTPDGGYAMVGASNSGDWDFPKKDLDDAIIIKVDKNGKKQWVKNYGGSLNENFLSIATTTDGGYVAVGFSRSGDGDFLGYHGSGDAIIAKVDKDGNIKWAKCFGGNSDDLFHSVIAAKDGGYIAVGESDSIDGDLAGAGNKGDYDAIIAKFDDDGSVKWVKKYGGSNYDVFYSLAATKDGGYVAVGETFSSDVDLSANQGNADFLIAKLDKNGNKVWMKSLGGSGYDELYSVTQAPGGGYFVVGESESSGGVLPVNKGDADAIIAKFSETGNKVWLKNFGGSDRDAFTNVTQAIGGGCIAVGYSRSLTGDFLGNKGLDDAIIAKFDNNGKKKWTKIVGGADNELFTGVIKAFGGGYVACGGSSSSDGDLFWKNNGSRDVIIAKLLEKYKVSFKVNGGKKLSKAKQTKIVSVGAKYGKLPTPKRPGYKFKGWYTKKKGGKKITAKSIVLLTKNTPLYAQWKKKK